MLGFPHYLHVRGLVHLIYSFSHVLDLHRNKECVCICVCVCVPLVCVLVCVCVCVCVYMCVYLCTSHSRRLLFVGPAEQGVCVYVSVCEYVRARTCMWLL